MWLRSSEFGDRASSVFGASGNPGGAAEKVNYRGLVMPSALTPSPAGRSRHRARCARAGTAERCLRRLSAKKYELLDIEKMLSQPAIFPFNSLRNQHNFPARRDSPTCFPPKESRHNLIAH